jgi:hypothetical protein
MLIDRERRAYSKYILLLIGDILRENRKGCPSLTIETVIYIERGDLTVEE